MTTDLAFRLLPEIAAGRRPFLAATEMQDLYKSMIIFFQNKCRGDSGSSLSVQHEPGVDTIEAILSGGVGKCGAGHPTWWIKVSAYYDWITCIVDGIAEGKSKNAIERLCTWNWKVANIDRFPPKNKVFD